MHQKQPPAKVAVAVALFPAPVSAAVAANVKPSNSAASAAMNPDRVMRIANPCLSSSSIMTGRYADGCASD